MKKLHSPTLQSLSDLLFPRSCLGCNRYLNFYESTLCITCQIELPQTHFQNTRKNPVFNKLDLLFPIEAATAAFIFQKTDNSLWGWGYNDGRLGPQNGQDTWDGTTYNNPVTLKRSV